MLSFLYGRLIKIRKRWHTIEPNVVESLPLDVLGLVFDLLPIRDLVNVRRVSAGLRRSVDAHANSSRDLKDARRSMHTEGRKWKDILGAAIDRHSLRLFEWFIVRNPEKTLMRGLFCAARRGDEDAAVWFIDRLVLMDFGSPHVWIHAVHSAARGNQRGMIDTFREVNPPGWGLAQYGQSFWDTIMCAGARGGHCALVEWAAENGSKKWVNGLAGAVRGGHDDLIEWFYQKAGTIAAIVLNETMHSGRIDLVERFALPHSPDESKLLRCAALNGHMNMVRHYLKGAKKTDTAVSEALCAAIEKGHLEVAQFLSQEGTIDWDAALHSAVQSGRMSSVEWTVRMGAKNWNAVLLDAIDRDNLRLVKFFARRGATNRYEAFMLARDLHHEAIAAWLRRDLGLWFAAYALDEWSNKRMDAALSLPDMSRWWR